MNVQSIFCLAMAACMAPLAGLFAIGREEIDGKIADLPSDSALDDELRTYLAKRRHFSPAVKPKAVSIGDYQVWAAGGMYLTARDLEGYDLLVPLTQHMAFGSGKRYQILAVPMRDFGGVCNNFRYCLEEIVAELRQGARILIFCDGGLGRTGTVLASLAALLESRKETPDPIAAIRSRYNDRAVETYEQVEAVFQLRGQRPPSDYELLKQVLYLSTAHEKAPLQNFHRGSHHVIN
ncbi:MAG: hypothetical protein JSS86_07930 [Cyanobacteria bacterium SZAS LIN-2]|nr:hypothetical protein [Cyanobacteria bacterium SZAS LIN-2]